MKIAVHLSIEMDAEQVDGYCAEYGIERDEVRDSVKSYVLAQVQGSPAFIDDGADITAR